MALLDRLETSNEGYAAALVDFEVEHVRLFNSNPAIYELTIEGKPLRFTSAQLQSARTFVTRFLDALNRIPSIPRKPQDWAPIVNEWLKDPEVVEQPPDASEEYALCEAVQRAIADLPPGEEAEDLDHGKCLVLDEYRVFKTDALMRVLLDDRPKLRREELSRVLRDLGYVPRTRRMAGKVVRGWSL
ncbi:MAG: hypothetical protein IH859_01065 [Chloroflexi bacterium]|nr:hypothetical protein [Chloroflexota bacterium]